ncbi:MAG: hypothetical protein AAFZ15_34395 [Bacteroidota bacterium]
MHLNLILTCAALLLALSGCMKKAADKSEATTEKAINLCGPTIADLNTEPGNDGKLTPLFTGLDVYHFPITTSSDLAQRYFDQGFLLNYGFNHAEASRSFREAIRQDPDCAMCYWGLGYVLGPNYNATMEVDLLPAANEAIANAKLRMHLATPKEQALIKALDRRYPKDEKADPAPYYEAYADAMKKVHQQFPEDADIAAMAAEAVMDLHPWDIWNKDGTPQPWTNEILRLLDQALNVDPTHPQAMHLTIHALEASPNPENALTAANELRFRVPGSGHLVHMPSHLYINTGHYHEGTLANERAVKIDSAYVEACSANGLYPLAYYPHNWHFLAACAALEGKGERALEASRYMANYVVDKELMYAPEWGTLQHFYTIPWYIMVKFAMWEEIANEPQPDSKLPYASAIWHYAQGMASASAGDFSKSAEHLQYLTTYAEDTLLAQMTVFDINSLAELVSIAENVVKGELAHRKGDLNESINYFTKAIEIEDQLSYNEPPDWFFSVRHLLGAVLIKNSQFADAEKVYREDLAELKNNGWALMGLYKSLEKQGKKEEAKKVKQQYNVAWQWADRPLESSVL